MTDLSLIVDAVRQLGNKPIQKRAIANHAVLNEVYAYEKPSSFSRGMSTELGGLTILPISGTASIDENGKSLHVGDFRGQMRRTFHNITALLAAEGATWHDVVRISCYLRDIDRDYDVFNEERAAFYAKLGLDPLPASTGIEAKLCRPELLVEIEGIAMFRRGDGDRSQGEDSSIGSTSLTQPTKPFCQTDNRCAESSILGSNRSCQSLAGE